MDNKYKVMGNFYAVNTRNAKEKSEYYLFDDEDLVKGDKVVVETALGTECGLVVSDKKEEEINSGEENYKRITRKANSEDIAMFDEVLALEREMFPLIKKIVDSSGLNMNVVEVKYTLDKTKVLISYVAEERVDFRDLLKSLANELKCRIELRQIGSRDRSAVVGGLGSCGLPICCNSFLREFDGISINMAKNQMLALNIQKLSGHCGKLLCCLKYEDQFYTEAKKGLDKPGFRITYKGKQYKVATINYISGVVTLTNEDGNENITVDELRSMKKNG
jgi:cell fate regulator YaaT (PSP1 superfamily)